MIFIPDTATKTGYCIYIDTICQGPVPVERDESGNPVVYETELDGQRVIVEDTMERLLQFLAGEREFEDAMTVEEYIRPVGVLADGSVIDENDNHFGANNW